MSKSDEIIGGAIRKLDKFVYHGVNSTLTGKSALPPSAQWGLALAAMYSRVNGWGDHALQPSSSILGAASTEMLKEWWGVDGETPAKRRNQAIDVLNWLANEGHRSSPEYAEPGDREAAKDLLAWDIARLVMVTRTAFQAEYISEEEGWAYVRDAARMAQASFSSWDDYANRYNRGRYRWSGGPEKTVDDAIEFLLKDAKSPWRTLDWDLPLKDEDFRSPVTQYLAVVARRHEKAQRYFAVAFVVVAVIGVVLKMTDTDLNVDRLFSHSSRQAQTDAALEKEFAHLNPTLQEAKEEAQKVFSKIGVEFYRSFGQIQADFRNRPMQPGLFAAFRYGINTAIPDSMPQQKLLMSGVPTSMDVPSDTRFLTIQAQFRDGTMSPIRRFDVPAGVRQ